MKYGLLLIGMLLMSFLSGQSDMDALDQALKEQDYLKSLQLAEACYEQDTSNLKCLKISSTSAFRLGSQAKAKKYLHLMEKMDSMDTDVLVQLATIYDQQQQLPKAIKYDTLLNKVLPNNPIYFRKNAVLYTKYKDYAKAFELYAEANKLNPEDVVTLKGMSELCFANDQMALGDSLLDAGLKVDSLNIGLNYVLVKSKYRQKRYDTVTVILEKLSGRIDLDSYYNKLLGYSYLQIDSVDLAIKRLSLAIVDDEENERLHYYLANAFEKKNNLKAAIEEFEKAAFYGVSPQIDLYHRNIARLANREKQYKKAIDHYKDAYKYGDDPVLLYYLAAACDNYYKDKSIALNYYKKYLRTEHDHIQYMEYAEKRVRYLKEVIHQQK